VGTKLEEENLNKLLDSVQFLEQLIGQKITYVGIFDNFAAMEFTNAYSFIVPKDTAPPAQDMGYYYAFEKLPKIIEKYGVKCCGYYIEHNDVVILISPRELCKGGIKIISRRERVGIADAIMSSLFSMFDNPSGHIMFRNKILGVLSFTNISPLVDLALQKLRKLIKAGAKFVKRDEKTIETGWLKKISFGVKPILFNNIEIDFDELERKLAHMKIRFDEEISKIKKMIDAFISSMSERIIVYRTGEKKIIGKTVAIEGKISNYDFILLLTRLMRDFSSPACIDKDAFNVALALVSKADKVCVSNKEYPTEKFKLGEMKSLDEPKLHPLLMCISIITGNVSIQKFRIGKMNGIAIKGYKDNLGAIAIIY